MAGLICRLRLNRDWQSTEQVAGELLNAGPEALDPLIDLFIREVRLDISTDQEVSCRVRDGRSPL